MSEPTSDLEQIDQIARRFEREWRSRTSPVIPAIRPHVESAPREIRATLLRELISIDVEYRRSHGEPCSSEVYQREFPELLADLALRRLIVTGPTEPADAPSRPDSSGLPVSRQSIDAHRPVKHIGKYLVLAALDSGGQADVFLALHPLLKTQVVLKLFTAATPSPGQMARVIREGQALTALDHPNIAKVYDCDLDCGRPFLVIEHIRGQNLAQLAAAGPVAPAQAAQLVAQAARALGAAHAAGILHRDVKPQNILIDQASRVKLIDFGLARGADESWAAGGGGGADAEARRTIAGTLLFMAPEQARGLAEVDPRSDLYSLGAVLYFLLTGSPPYAKAERDRGALLAKVQAGDFDRDALARLPAPSAIKRVCLKAMAFNPIERYQDAASLEADLLAAGRPGPMPSRRTIVAAGGATLALAAAVPLFLRLKKPPPASAPTSPIPPPRALPMIDADIVNLFFSADGQHLVAIGRNYANVWSTLSPNQPPEQLELGGNKAIWSANGRFLLAGHQLRDLTTGSSRLVVFPEHPGKPSVEQHATALSNDGLLAAVAETLSREDETVEYGVTLCSTDDRRVLRRLTDNHTDKVVAVAFSPDAAQLISGVNGGAVGVWDVTVPEEPRAVQWLTDHKANLAFVFFCQAADPPRLCTRDWNGVTFVRDALPAVSPGQRKYTQENDGCFSTRGFGAYAGALDTAGTRLIVGYNGGEGLFYHDLSRKMRVKFPVSAERFQTGAISANGRRVIVGTWAGPPEKRTSNFARVFVWEPTTETTEKPLVDFPAPTDLVTAVAITPDGRRAAAVAGEKVYVWDLPP